NVPTRTARRALSQAGQFHGRRLARVNSKVQTARSSAISGVYHGPIERLLWTLHFPLDRAPDATGVLLARRGEQAAPVVLQQVRSAIRRCRKATPRCRNNALFTTAATT